MAVLSGFGFDVLGGEVDRLDLAGLTGRRATTMSTNPTLPIVALLLAGAGSEPYIRALGCLACQLI